MKDILCFGDSNTWGYCPETQERFEFNTGWTGVLQSLLGNGYRIIEEGLNARTTILDDPDRPNRSGMALLPTMLECHRPLDWVIIVLGTNDLKSVFECTPQQIAAGAKTLCEEVLNNDYLQDCSPQVLLVSPAHIAELPAEDLQLMEGAKEKSLKLSCYYQQVANDLRIQYINAADIVTTTDIDGIHWQAFQHRDFAVALADFIKGNSRP